MNYDGIEHAIRACLDIFTPRITDEIMKSLNIDQPYEDLPEDTKEKINDLKDDFATSVTIGIEVIDMFESNPTPSNN